MSTPPNIPNGALLYTQGYGSVSSNSLINIVRATRDPTSSDVKGTQGTFSLGQRWLNITSMNVWTLALISSFNGVVSATWVQDSAGTGSLNELAGNTGIATPSGGIINVVGTQLYNTVASGSTVTITPDTGAYPITPFVVGPVGQAGYQTIQSAINAAHAASGGGAAGGYPVYILPGIYTENLTLYTGVSLTAVTGNVDDQHVQIYGVHTPPTNNGVLSFLEINFFGTDKIFYSTAAGQAYLAFQTCNWTLSAPGYIFDMDNWVGPTGLVTGIAGVAAIDSGDLSAANSGFVKNTVGGMAVIVTVCNVGANGNVPLLMNGTFQSSITDIYCDIHLSGGGSATPANSQFFEQSAFHGCTLTVSGNSYGTVGSCNFTGISSTAFTMSSSANWEFCNNYVSTSGTPAIGGSGAGVLSLSGNDFVGNSTIAGTLTLNTSVATNTGKLLTAGNLAFQNAGNKITSASVGTTTSAGANSIGSVTLVGGTATVSTTAVTASSLINVWRQSVGSTGNNPLGSLSVGTITDGTSFVINSWEPTSATTLQASDVSVIGWSITN